jgi:diguanylate cyclase (GGDEF)-like protein/PAS domain S-box-containing protein
MPEGLRPLLVVDDSEANRDLLSRRLARAGFDVETAADAPEALDCLRRREADLVLLDSMMPGMSGLELLRLLRATYTAEQLPVIMVTAISSSEKVVEALNAGANDYITKPIDFAVALARIQSQLARKRAEESLRVSEERYSLAARGANDGLWDWDLRTDRIYYSERWREILGLDGAVLADRPSEWRSRIHPADAEDFERQLGRLLEGAAEDFTIEQRLARADGGYCWGMVRGYLLRDGAGRPLRMAGSLTDITESKAFDSLTGLPNRRLLSERITRAMEQDRAGTARYAVLYLDLDRFQVVNDSLGHAAGDVLLIAFARRLQSLVRDGRAATQPEGPHVIARIGGDEFALLLEDVRDLACAERVAARILAAAPTPYEVNGRELFIGVSIGIAMGDAEHASPDDVLRDADTALFRAKALGRGRAHVFSVELRAAVLLRLETESELRRAIDAGELYTVYQPKVSLRAGELVGFEALLRWRHPRRGVVEPNEFIPIAEETGLIVPLGRWVLRDACRQLRAWQEACAGQTPLEVSVNLSPRQFRDPSLIGSLREVLEETGIPPHTLQLEITESVLIEEQEEAFRVLGELSRLGVGLKLDDFGTGYSSLNYLCRLPCDSLKIDRSFVSQMCGSQSTLQVVRTIISLAQSLQLRVTAEGIETSEQAETLRNLGCDFGQGYYFAQPLSVEDATRLMQSPQRLGVV